MFFFRTVVRLRAPARFYERQRICFFVRQHDLFRVRHNNSMIVSEYVFSINVSPDLIYALETRPLNILSSSCVGVIFTKGIRMNCERGASVFAIDK